MLHCPACDYELGTLPGVPPDAGAAFAEDVRCPECGHGMPRGTRLLHGTQWVAALQPATPWARLSAMLAPVGFAIYIGLKNGIEGVVGLLGVVKSRGLWIDLLLALMLPVMAYVAWRSIRLWRSGSEAGGEARRQLAGREITWQVTPGSFEIFRRASHDGTPATELHQAADLRRVTVHPAPSVRIRKGAVPRNVVLVEAFFWTRGTDGRRSDLRSVSMYADAGGELAGARTGHRAAAIAAGQRLAEGIEATLRGAESDEQRESARRRLEEVATALGDACQNLGVLCLTLEGDPRAAKEWLLRSLETGVDPREEVRGKGGFLERCQAAIDSGIDPRLRPEQRWAAPAALRATAKQQS